MDSVADRTRQATTTLYQFTSLKIRKKKMGNRGINSQQEERKKGREFISNSYSQFTFRGTK